MELAYKEHLYTTWEYVEMVPLLDGETLEQRKNNLKRFDAYEFSSGNISRIPHLEPDEDEDGEPIEHENYYRAEFSGVLYIDHSGAFRVRNRVIIENGFRINDVNEGWLFGAEDEKEFRKYFRTCQNLKRLRFDLEDF